MKILILCLPGIGDALMATPMIRILKKEKPDAQIDVACMFGGVQYVFKNNKNVNKIHFLRIYKQNRIAGLFRILSLRKQKYDVSILAFPAYRREYHLVQWLIGAKRRISHTFGHGHYSEFNYLETDLVPVDESEHHVPNNLNLLKPLGINWEKKYRTRNLFYDLILDKEDVGAGKTYIKELGWSDKTIVGFHPGSINSKVGVLKRWPLKNFAVLAKKFISQDKKVLIFIGPDEADLGGKLEVLIDNKRDYQLVNNLKFNQSVGLLSRLDLLITNDNGFAHLANALQIKSIVLFGPTNPLWCRPYNDKYSIVIHKAPFKPWFKNDIKVDSLPGGVKGGMEYINVDDVLTLIH